MSIAKLRQKIDSIDAHVKSNGSDAYYSDITILQVKGRFVRAWKQVTRFIDAYKAPVSSSSDHSARLFGRIMKLLLLLGVLIAVSALAGAVPGIPGGEGGSGGGGPGGSPGGPGPTPGMPTSSSGGSNGGSGGGGGR